MWIRKEKSVDSFNQLDMESYTKELASSSPVPGGGGAAAYTAALAAALGEMVGSLTVGKKRYADAEPEIRRAMESMDELRTKLLSMSDRDAEGFLPLADALRMPKSTPEEQKERQAALEEGYKKACEAPFETIHILMDVIALLELFAKKGSRVAVSDAGVGALFAEAALKGSALNVYINTKYMKDREYARSLNTETYEIVEEYTERAEKIYRSVQKGLIGQ